MFPEGTRSLDGELKPVKSGFCTLAKKTKVTIMPVAIEGACQVLPPGSLIPNLGETIQVVFGEAIEPEDYVDLSDDELTALLEEKIRECFLEARALKKRTAEGAVRSG